MRNIYLFLLLSFLLVADATAQIADTTSTDTSKLMIVDKKWGVSLRPSTHLTTEDPFRANDEARQAQRDIKENMRQNQIRAQAGLPPEAPRPRMRPIETSSASDQYDSGITYLYEIKVKNIGEKTIQSITWDYVFFEEGTNQEVGRRRFTSKITIPAGKTKNSVMRSVAPPTGTINLQQAGKKSQDQYTEQIVIHNIEFSDGSVWRAK